MDTLLEILNLHFLLRNALYGGLVIGAVAPLVGVYLLARRMVFIGIALPQVSTAGVAGAFVWHTFFHGHPSRDVNDFVIALVGSSVLTFAVILVLALLERRRRGLLEGRIAMLYAVAGAATILLLASDRVTEIGILSLLKGEIIQSGNDACIALAEGIGGNEATFAEMLNTRAREIGLTRSNFTNATGLPDPNLKVTARELAKLAQHIIKTYPDFYSLFGEREFTWNKIRQQNRNPLLAMGIGADGLKTGFTREAGYGLVGSAVQNGLRLIAVINGAKTPKERADEARSSAMPSSMAAAPATCRSLPARPSTCWYRATPPTGSSPAWSIPARFRRRSSKTSRSEP